MSFEIKKAAQVQSKARIAIEGPAGSGKTYSALVLAQVFGSKVIVIDTERGSSAKYANEWPPFEYDVLDLPAPYTPARYIDAIKYCEVSGYDVIIIDSLSHAWAGEGGALQMVDEAKVRSGGNTYYAWRDVTPQQQRMVDAMLSSEAHIIACMRTKTEYAEETDKGRKTYRKVGTQPIQREGMDYEFDVVFTLTIENKAMVTKTRYSPITGNVYEHIDSDVGNELKTWLDSGEKVEVERPKTQSDLIAYAKGLGLDSKEVGVALKGAGFKSFQADKWDEMVAAVEAAKE